MPDKISEELQDSLRDIVILCDKEDEELRKVLLRQWSKNENFWRGLQYLFWSQRGETWRSPVDFDSTSSLDDSPARGSFSDVVVDIFKAHGESIIAALSAQTPTLRFLPDDADDEDDVLTARTYNKIGDVVQRHNKAKLVSLRALFFLYLQGLVASYRYKESDFRFGSYKVPVYATGQQSATTLTCQQCGMVRETNDVPCPQCGSMDLPEASTSMQDVPMLSEVKEHPKTRVKLDVFGPQNFKIPYYARNQAECGYLVLYLDQAKDMVIYRFAQDDDELADKIRGEDLDTTERFTRADYEVEFNPGSEQSSLVTVCRAWIRPWKFNLELDSAKRKKLFKLFPKGVNVTFVGKQKVFISAVEESLDDRWEIGQAGLSTFIHSNPVCTPVVEIQELRNQVINLIKDTIEHGIPSEFADPSVLKFSDYGSFEATPGFIYQAVPRTPTTPLSQSFYTSNRATLSREVSMFLNQIDRDAQFALGSFPSIYGGPSEGKSRTFSEYAASRQMALQRLSILWSLFVDWWVRTIEGCVKMYAECVVEDENFAHQESEGYINVWIRRSEMNGKVGGVESEASDSFPVSLMQKKDLLMKLMELNNEFINAALYQPENARVIQDVLALNELKLPGETQRIKQVLEISEMTRPGVAPVQDELGGFVSTVAIDLDVDDHIVHSKTLRSYLADLSGIDLKKRNPAGYMNCVVHDRAHQKEILNQTLAASPTPPGEKPETTAVGGVE